MAGGKPNILILWGDDIGLWNISAVNHGMMGYQTPNIDRIAHEGIGFTDYYGQQSCTAGRAAFITGQNPVRTGLSKVGVPGADIGLQAGDPTIAELLKPLGYATGQFGKNHFGDKDEFLPTNHGFDEFFGNLYHLNAEEEPENPDYPKDARFRQHMPRGVIHSFSDGRIVDTGPLTKKRMETVDDEITDKALDFIDRAHKAGKPFFLWWNATHMHVWTHTRPQDVGRSRQGFYNDAMVYHDECVGRMLAKLDDLGIAGDTIVMYSTDNGPHYNTWPDGAITPFRSEKNTNWEGAWRVPCFIRWPGRIPAGKILNDIVAHQDMLPTLLTAAGEPDIKAKLLRGHKAAGKTFRVHIDGENMLDYFTGKAKESPRKAFFYVNDDGGLCALRFGDWKAVFMEQRAKQFACWSEPFVTLRIPKLFHLRRDPFERADENSNSYQTWWLEHSFMLGVAAEIVGHEIQSLVAFPPRQKPQSFNLDQILDQLKETQGSALH